MTQLGFITSNNLLYQTSRLTFDRLGIICTHILPFPNLRLEIDSNPLLNTVLIDFESAHINIGRLTQSLTARKIRVIILCDDESYETNAHLHFKCGVYSVVRKSSGFDEIVSTINSQGEPDQQHSDKINPLRHLRAKQVQILFYLYKEYSQSDISRMLDVSRQDINGQVTAICNHLNVKSTGESRIGEMKLYAQIYDITKIATEYGLFEDKIITM